MRYYYFRLSRIPFWQMTPWRLLREYSMNNYYSNIVDYVIEEL